MLLTIPLHIAVNARRHFPITYKTFPMSVPTEQYYLLWHGIHHNDPAHRWLREQMLPPLINSTYSPNPDKPEPKKISNSLAKKT